MTFDVSSNQNDLFPCTFINKFTSKNQKAVKMFLDFTFFIYLNEDNKHINFLTNCVIILSLFLKFDRDEGYLKRQFISDEDEYVIVKYLKCMGFKFRSRFVKTQGLVIDAESFSYFYKGKVTSIYLRSLPRYYPGKIKVDFATSQYYWSRYHGDHSVNDFWKYVADSLYDYDVSEIDDLSSYLLTMHAWKNRCFLNTKKKIIKELIN